MSAVRERLIGAVEVMDDESIRKLWKIVESNFSTKWEDISEEEPDDWDNKMIEDIKNNPDCKVFTDEADIIWN